MTEYFLPVADLGDRYEIDRSNVYARMKRLGIVAEKQGGKSYLNPDQLKLMDALDEHIKDGGAIADFSQDRPTRQTRLSRETAGQMQPAPISLIQPDLIDHAVEAIAARFAPPQNPLANLEALQRAYECGWLLSSSQLAPLLGMKTLHGKEIQRFGFTFTHVGKNGPESAWKISKGEG